MVIAHAWQSVFRSWHCTLLQLLWRRRTGNKDIIMEKGKIVINTTADGLCPTLKADNFFWGHIVAPRGGTRD